MMASMSNIQRLLFVAFLILGVSACGFHLRGQTPIPERLKTLILTSDSGSKSFDRSLRIALARAGVSIVDQDKAEEGVLELKVDKIKTSDTVLARNSSNDITQISRKLSTTYFIRQGDGKSLYGPRNISTTLTLSNQNAEESTKDAYNKTQTETMYDDLATQLIYDLPYAPL